MPSLYIHVPFCLRKCAYCAFYSIPLTGCREDLKALCLQAVTKEIKLRSKEAQEGVSSLFLGGGTPTALEPRELDSLLSAIHKNFSFRIPQSTASPAEGLEAQQKEDPDRNSKQSVLAQSIQLSAGGKEKELKKCCREKSAAKPPKQTVEKTVEANPGTLTKEKLTALVSYGINRISLGAQSFNDRMLTQIGRIHNTEDIWQSVRLIRQAGIHNLNLDLIFGLPGQTLADWQDTLRRAVELEPEHLSLYALTIEEGTPLGRMYGSYHGQGNQETDSQTKNRTSGLPLLPDDDLQADMYEWAAGFLQEQGYQHYEISNFARAGFQCRHNLAYWQSEEYLGLGPGAVSCLRGIRTRNSEDLKIYEKLICSGREAFDPAATEILTREQLISEYMMLALRTAAGVDLAAFTDKFGQSVQDIYSSKLVKYMDREILLLDRGRLKVHPNYYFVINSLLEDVMLAAKSN
ncbi:MAG: radical SAM family heme chaperone HemW [Desulfitobacteriia bacterium]|jgi:oxygen-independent coproporphyrinogen-3 oxidase